MSGAQDDKRCLAWDASWHLVGNGPHDIFQALISARMVENTLVRVRSQENSGTPQGILQKTPLFFFLYALDRPAPVGTHPHPTGHPSKNDIFLLFIRVRNDPEPKPLDPPRSPCPAKPSRPLVYPPVHQASSGGYPPPPPHRASLKKRHFSSFCKPSVPFLGTFRESGELLCRQRVLVLPQHSSKVRT